MGAGGIANNHASRISNINEAEIVSVSDVEFEKAKKFAEKWGGKPFDSWEKMYRNTELDAVWICIPPFAHTNEVMEAAERGINIFIEKPIALSLDLAKKMEKAVIESGIISWVGYHFRQSYSVRYVKDLLCKQGGNIGLLLGRWWGGIVGGPGHWWWKKEKSGGQIVEQATHIYDLARFLAGDVVSVYAEIDKVMYEDLSEYTIEDVAATVLRFKNNAVGVITNTSAAKKNGHKVEMEVVSRHLQAFLKGTHKAIIYGEKGMLEIESFNDPYFDEDYKFIKAVLSDGESEVPISEGVKTLEVTLAALEASLNKKVIYL